MNTALRYPDQPEDHICNCQVDDMLISAYGTKMKVTKIDFVNITTDHKGMFRYMQMFEANWSRDVKRIILSKLGCNICQDHPNATPDQLNLECSGCGRKLNNKPIS